MSAPDPAAGRVLPWRCVEILGAVVGYGGLVAFLCLIGLQVYRWFRDGEWTHIGMNAGIKSGLLHCCVNDGDSGRLAAFVHWVDTPTDWLGLHTTLDVIPASLALFVVSILGNSVFIFCRDRIDELQRPT